MRRALAVPAVLAAAIIAPLIGVSVASAGTITIAVSKTHTGSFVVGGTGTFTIGMSIACCSTGSTQFTFTDTLPAGLTYDATGSGNATWSCNASGQTVTCTGTPTLTGQSSSTFPLVVNVLPAAFPSVTNQVTESDNACNGCFGYSNNPASDTANVTLATPPAYTKEPGEGTGFPTVLNSFQATGLAQSVTTTDGSNTITLDIPQAALTPLTQVTIYKGSSTALQGDLPSGASYVDGYAVAWQLLGQTSTANSAITMTVKDAGVAASSTIYSTTGSALATTTATVTTGQYVVSFTADPAFVAAKVSTTATPTPPVPATGAGSGWMLALLVLALGLPMTALRAARRRKRTV